MLAGLLLMVISLLMLHHLTLVKRLLEQLLNAGELLSVRSRIILVLIWAITRGGDLAH